MERKITNVPANQKNFVIVLAKADGLTVVEEIKEPGGTFTIIARKPTAAPTTAAAGAGAGESIGGGEVLAPGISAAAANFMVEHERFVPFRYQDIADNATIGYGHHKGLTKDQIDAEFPNGLTEKEAWELFLSDTAEFADAVKRKAPAGLAQNEFDALVMVAFQTGNINRLKDALDRGDHEAVAAGIESITTAGGQFSAGVAARTAKVAAIYRNGIYPKPEKTRETLRARGIKDIEKLYPNKLNSVGNNFGRPTEENQKLQAERAYFRMTGKNV